jgi:hypothetical protein
MALAQYPPFLDRQLPIQSKHPYLLSVAPKQALPMSNPYSWNKSTSGLEPWDAPQTSWTIDSSYSTLQSAVQPSEPTSSQSAASGAHPLQHPLPESPRCDPSLASRLSVTELGHLSSHSPGLRGLDSMFRFPPSGGDLLYTMDDGLDVEQAALLTHRSTPLVKEEQEDGSVTAAFVFESSPSTPGPANEGPRETQVPLRATQATKAMRKMMSVFRLNPFAVQGSAPTVEEAGPLEEEGRLFEFQLRLGDTTPPSSPPVRSGSTLPESRTTSPGDDWMGRARPPSELGNRPRMVETPGTTDGSGWSYQLPTDLSPPFTLPPGVVECREPAGVRCRVGHAWDWVSCRFYQQRLDGGFPRYEGGEAREIVDNALTDTRIAYIFRRQVRGMVHTARARRVHRDEVGPIIAGMGTGRSKNKAIGGTAGRRGTLLGRRRPGQATQTCLRCAS